MTKQPNHNDSLAWALARVAQLQGEGFSDLRFQALLQGVPSPVVMTDLSRLLSQMDLPPAPIIEVPDRTRLPMLCLVPEQGWGVVVDQSPQGDWGVEFRGQVTWLTAQSIGGVALVNMRPLKAVAEHRDNFETMLRMALRRYRGAMAEAALASLFIGVIALASTLYSMQVYDRVIPTRSEYTLLILSSGVILAVLIEMAMKFARARLMDGAAAGIDSHLSRDIFQRLLGVRVDQLPGSVGSLAGQIRGYEQIRSFYTGSTLFALVDLPMSLVFLLVIVLLGSPLVALVPFCCGVLALLIGLSKHRRVNALALAGAQAANRKTGLLVEAVEGAETIKAGGGQWKFLSRWLDVSTETIRQDADMRHVSESAGYLAAALQQLSYMGIVAVGAWVVIKGDMTTGALIACSIIGGRVMAPFAALPGLIVQHAHAGAAKRSLEKLYALETDQHGVSRPLSPASLSGDFLLQDVRFAYGENLPAVDVAQLRIKAGEKVAVLGPIGAGKSTLLKLLAGLYKPTSGRVLIDGLDMSQVNRQVLYRRLGYLQQEHRLFEGTLRENLLIGLPDPGDEVMRLALVRSGLIQLVSGHPRGLELPIQEGGKGLSGGQRQLVAFTRLLLVNPSVMLLDEPTANMDQEQERRCLSVLSEMAGPENTLVVVTHKPSLLPLVDRVVVVSGCQIIMDGPRDAVMARLKQGAGNARAASAAPMPINNARREA